MLGLGGDCAVGFRGKGASERREGWEGGAGEREIESSGGCQTQSRNIGRDAPPPLPPMSVPYSYSRSTRLALRSRTAAGRGRPELELYLDSTALLLPRPVRGGRAPQRPERLPARRRIEDALSAVRLNLFRVRVASELHLLLQVGAPLSLGKRVADGRPARRPRRPRTLHRVSRSLEGCVVVGEATCRTAKIPLRNHFPFTSN